MLPSLDEIPKKRKMLSLTQQRLAELSGVSQSLIAKIESGKINPSYKKVKAIFESLRRLETSKNFCAKEILHGKVIGVQKDDEISKAMRLMMEHGYSQLPVFDGKHLVGAITEKTILNQFLSGRDLSQISESSVEQIMADAFPQISEDTPLRLVSNLLQFYPAVLVSRKGAVVGIITKADLFKMIV